MTDESTYLICPVMSEGSSLAKCIGKKCAWWDADGFECIVLSAGKAILEEIEFQRIQ